MEEPMQPEVPSVAPEPKKLVRRHHVYFVVPFLLLVVLLAGSGVSAYLLAARYKGSSNNPPPPSPSVTAVVSGVPVVSASPSAGISPVSSITGTEGLQTVVGPITAVDTGCNNDAVCQIKVGDFWVVTNLGGDPTRELAAQRGPRGSIILANGTVSGSIPKTAVGKQVQVFGKKVDSSTISLYGSSSYYIKFQN